VYMFASYAFIFIVFQFEFYGSSSKKRETYQFIGSVIFYMALFNRFSLYEISLCRVVELFFFTPLY
jgi:hypothetical protein